MNIFNRKKHEKVIVVGCGFIGVKLAAMFDAQYDDVSIIDLNENTFSGLSHSSNFSLIAGDATDTEVLEFAGIKTADIIIAATSDDNTNITVAKLAKEYYKVHQVIARVDDTSKEFAYKHTGINVISPLILLLNEIQNILVNENGG